MDYKQFLKLVKRIDDKVHTYTEVDFESTHVNLFIHNPLRPGRFEVVTLTYEQIENSTDELLIDIYEMIYKDYFERRKK